LKGVKKTMDKLCKFIDRELEDLENKAAASGKLSGAEVSYGKELAKFKSALLTNKAMEEEGYSLDYSGAYPYNHDRSMRGNSYDYDSRMSGARGRGSNAKRDSRGRYSSDNDYSRAAKEDFVEEVYELMEKAPDDHTRKKLERLVDS